MNSKSEFRQGVVPRIAIVRGLNNQCHIPQAQRLVRNIRRQFNNYYDICMRRALLLPKRSTTNEPENRIGK